MVGKDGVTKPPTSILNYTSHILSFIRRAQSEQKMEALSVTHLLNDYYFSGGIGH